MDIERRAMGHGKGKMALMRGYFYVVPPTPSLAKWKKGEKICENIIKAWMNKIGKTVFMHLP